ncbi:unnamed protein product, partial [Symbiodinium sp. KB8]
MELRSRLCKRLHCWSEVLRKSLEKAVGAIRVRQESYSKPRQLGSALRALFHDFLEKAISQVAVFEFSADAECADESDKQTHGDERWIGRRSREGLSQERAGRGCLLLLFGAGALQVPGLHQHCHLRSAARGDRRPDLLRAIQHGARGRLREASQPRTSADADAGCRRGHREHGGQAEKGADQDRCASSAARHPRPDGSSGHQLSDQHRGLPLLVGPEEVHALQVRAL